MKKIGFVVGMVVCLFTCCASAQVLKPVSFDYSGNNMAPKVIGGYMITPNHFSFLNTPSAYAPSVLMMKNNFKYTLPRGAIFCRMEEALYNKLNFWVKIRMGTDERYSN